MHSGRCRVKLQHWCPSGTEKKLRVHGSNAGAFVLHLAAFYVNGNVVAARVFWFHDLHKELI